MANLVAEIKASIADLHNWLTDYQMPNRKAQTKGYSRVAVASACPSPIWKSGSTIYDDLQNINRIQKTLIFYSDSNYKDANKLPQ